MCAELPRLCKLRLALPQKGTTVQQIPRHTQAARKKNSKNNVDATQPSSILFEKKKRQTVWHKTFTGDQHRNQVGFLCREKARPAQRMIFEMIFDVPVRCFIFKFVGIFLQKRLVDQTLCATKRAILFLSSVCRITAEVKGLLILILSLHIGSDHGTSSAMQRPIKSHSMSMKLISVHQDGNAVIPFTQLPARFELKGQTICEQSNLRCSTFRLGSFTVRTGRLLPADCQNVLPDAHRERTFSWERCSPLATFENVTRC